MNNYIVIARFDEATDKKLLNLRNKFENKEFCVQDWPPHMTIAAYENIDEKPLCDWTEKFIRNYGSFEIALNSLGVFPPSGDKDNSSVLFLAPAHSKTLVDFYYAFHVKFEEYCTGIGRYNSIVHGNPVIHCTLGVIERNRLQEVINIAFGSNIFTTAKITALELYTYPMKLIQRFELKKKGD